MVAPDPQRLERYVRCVAGAVGLLSMRVFGAWQGDPSRRFALSLARAMQLTNILRDVEEDARLGRLYLPAPFLQSAGIPPDPVLALSHPGLPEARRLLGHVARTQYRRARTARRGHVWLRILPALVMMGPYERLLAEMEADWSRAPLRRPGWRKAADGILCAGRGLGWR
jgi:phytoene synthase